MEHDIAFHRSQMEVARLDWQMDERPGLADRAYREFQRVLVDTFPEARVRVIVRRYFGEPRRRDLGRPRVTIRNDRYLGADPLDPVAARAAAAAIERAVEGQFREVLQSIIATHRAGDDGRTATDGDDPAGDL